MQKLIYKCTIEETIPSMKTSRIPTVSCSPLQHFADLYSV